VNSRNEDESGRLRKRFWCLMVLLVPANAYWIMQSEVIRYAGHPSTISLFYNCIFWLCLLLSVNSIIRKTLPRAALSRHEILTLYAVLGISTALAGHDLIQVLLPILAYPAFRADNVNRWEETLLPLLPRWLTVQNKEALKPFYDGHSSLYEPGHLSAWLVPTLVWSGFLATLCATFLCLNALLRQQWTRSERLAFPLIQLPLELSEPKAPLLRNKLFWAGVIIAVGIQTWNGMATLTPRIPILPIKYVDYGGSNFPNRPWSAIGWLPVGFYPFGIALGMLLPLDLSFSSWFFFLFWKAQLVVSAYFGWDQKPNFPYVDGQSLGAYLGIAGGALFAMRKRFAAVFWQLLENTNQPGDSDEPIPPRMAALGALLGLVLLFVFFRLAGMASGLAIAFLVIYFGLAVGITRMRAELGPPVHDLHHAGPDSFLPTVLGPTNLTKPDLMVLAMSWGFNRAYRTHPMPIQLEALKLTGREGRAGRPLFLALLLAGILGPLAGFWALLHLSYEVGAAGAVAPPNVMAIFGREAWARFDSWSKVPQPPQAEYGIATLGGGAFVLLLNLLRSRVMGFPFHPVGYAVASSWGMSVLWVPMLTAWALKLVLLRYGGLALYRKALPFFFGIILGECVAGSLWSLLGIWAGIPTYAFWP
jgi:hypothetical protein